MRRLQTTNERGAVAIFAAIMSLSLMAAGALAVDLGNAFARKRHVQFQADFAALAGASELGAGSSKIATDPAVITVAEYLNRNHAQDDRTSTPPAVTPAQLVNNDDDDGEVYFTGNQMRVIAPNAFVDFGLAGIVGFSDLNVRASATTGAFSPGLGAMPAYAWKACDWGAQFILDDSTDILAPLPLLAHPADANGAKVEDLSYVESTRTLTITGKHLSGVTSVGFFRTGSPPPAPDQVAPVSTPTNTLVTVVVPTSITTTEDVWWIRVYKASAWSPVAHGDIQPFVTGETAPECDSSSNEGNYGTFNIPRPSGDVTGMNEIIAKNIAAAPEISLSILPTGQPQCDGLPDPYDHVDEDPANCLPLKTGFPNPGATMGLIDGVDGVWGRLDHRNGDTNDACGGVGANDVVGSAEINNDYLTCFFTNDTVTIDDIARGSYAGPAVLSPEIFDSPRFTWLPIVKEEPAAGTGEYTLVDVRPAFLSDQPRDADRVNNEMGPYTNNGLVMGASGLRAVKAVIFNIKALPPAEDGSPVTPFVGVGDPLIRLTN